MAMCEIPTRHQWSRSPASHAAALAPVGPVAAQALGAIASIALQLAGFHRGSVARQMLISCRLPES